MPSNKKVFKRKKVELLLSHKRDKNKTIYPVIKSLTGYLDKLDKKINDK